MSITLYPLFCMQHMAQLPMRLGEDFTPDPNSLPEHLLLADAGISLLGALSSASLEAMEKSGWELRESGGREGHV